MVTWHQDPIIISTLGRQNDRWDTSSCTHKVCKVFLTVLENLKGKIIGSELYIFGSRHDKRVFITATKESFFFFYNHRVDMSKNEKQSLTL